MTRLYLDNYGSVAVGTSAVLIHDANSARKEIIVQNVHATQDLYVGSDSSVLTTTGLKIAAGTSRTLTTDGPVYGIASGASTDTRFLETL